MATQRIVSEPGIMMGKPVVEGTRITVEAILEDLGAGEAIEQVLEAHPRLTREGVLAAVRFGAEALRAGGGATLVELLREIPADYKAEEVDWGPPVGREVW